MTNTSQAVLPSVSSAEARVIQANQGFYRRIAWKYDRYDGSGFDSYLCQVMRTDLDRIASLHSRPASALHCLDCGGGTGNFAMELLDRGWNVTVVDISAEMLRLLGTKARSKGHSPTLIHSSIEQFLRSTHDLYDLVGFSSVLHHLYSYVSVLQTAASRIRPGGFLYSICDPVAPRHPRWTRTLDSLDIALAKAFFDRADILPGIGRRIRKLFMRKDAMFNRAVAGAGDIAEHHVRTGVDDEQVLQLLRERGFAVLEHARFATGRTAVVRCLNGRLRLLESFKIMAMRPAESTSGLTLR